ncbi:hypothetical protein LOTGIDRAFT_175025 [Lottia gigantea]|uniref:K Homology domain-containing protein n=1 Tax=Lottia gigantea TaxID=225164 RepID=V4C362_LOTGI|nr:hypothetical protein LOTGIDRAFT_175025 [Lottia gigantea]ESO95944.1 hypothetical protein LOTGIDRAFT_175025 [Lottia gigantea]
MSYGKGEADTFYVEQQHVGRIIGKGGERIRSLQTPLFDAPLASILMNSQELLSYSGEKGPISISGFWFLCYLTRSLIEKISVKHKMLKYSQVLVLRYLTRLLFEKISVKMRLRQSSTLISFLEIWRASNICKVFMLFDKVII